ncbi:MAG: type I restriction-modification system subunit M [Mycoplasmataceae bacterium]|nr:type I restriction-modification system subunit M [Mycoplasmataceae bacterium]
MSNKNNKIEHTHTHTQNSKESQRNELFRVIWKIANDLRGSIDGWDFKQYILGTLFYRFISENFCKYISETDDENYENIKDSEISNELKQEFIKEKGFFIYPSQLFCNVLKNTKDEEYKKHLNENLSNILKSIENSSFGTKSEEDFKGLFSDYDVNSNKLGGTIEERNKRLIQLLTAVSTLDFGDLEDNSIDLFGDAYEYLMAMYASNAGKSGGEFFTPQEVSELLARLAIGQRTTIKKVYDPACGSGGLLLKFAKILGKDNVKIGFFGQEKNPTTFNLCRINMFLHNINYSKFEIALGDTLLKPQLKDSIPFDAIVSNPPYSVQWEGDSDPLLINDPRFSPAGVLAPKSKADFAFIMHCLSYLSTDGTAAIVEFPGTLYRGGAEEKIRKYLIDNNYIDCIIQLPGNLFFGTSISTCIIVLKKSKKTNDVVFIDASKEYETNTNSNKLTQQNISNIYKYFNERKDIEFIVKVASYDEIVKKNYNLSVNNYVISEDTSEIIDIEEINKELEVTVKKIETLRAEINKIVKEIG